MRFEKYCFRSFIYLIVKLYVICTMALLWNIIIYCYINLIVAVQICSAKNFNFPLNRAHSKILIYNYFSCIWVPRNIVCVCVYVHEHVSVHLYTCLSIGRWGRWGSYIWGELLDTEASSDDLFTACFSTTLCKGKACL